MAEARQAVFLTQLELAEKVGVREKSVQRVELGKNAGISPARAVRYAAALGMSLEKFLSDVATTGKVEQVAYDATAAAVRWLEAFSSRRDASQIIKRLDEPVRTRLSRMLSPAEPRGSEFENGRRIK